MPIDKEPTLKALLRNEGVWVRTIALSKNRKEGIGILMSNPSDLMIRMNYPWGSIVYFREYNPDEIPIIVGKVSAVPNSPDWELV
jgi:hypothetical protein